MNAALEEHEGYHWNEQESWGPALPLWYGGYISEYLQNLIGYGFNSDLAHHAVSFEPEAISHAPGTGDPDPPSVFEYWWDMIF